jgi:membrane protein insertase Oxa1/YidC/SpoIIIJ
MFHGSGAMVCVEEELIWWFETQSNDPAQNQSQAILKFLPLMIGYFSLSVPSGLSLYW